MAIVETRNSEIVLDGVPFRIVGPLRVVNLATFPPKITIGDASKDSDQLLSSKVWSDFTGGLGVKHEQEGVDNNRFYDASADTRFPNNLSAKLALTSFAMSSSGTRPLGDYDGIAPGTVKFYAAGGTQLSSFDSSFARTDHGALTDIPVNRGVVFKGTGATKLLFIPQGDQGYQTWDGAAIAAQSTNALPIAFCEWDGKLFSLGSNGVLSENTDGSTTWTTKATLDASLTPKGLVAFFNRADEPTLHIVTDRDVWAYDASIPKLYRTHLQYPPHPYQGLASAEWRGDLYVSVGIGVHRYTGATISAMGLDSRDGLPAGSGYGQEKIVDFVPEYNGLMALSVDRAGTTSTLYQFTGIGWHKLSATASPPTWGILTNVGGNYHYVHGATTGSNLFRIKLRRQFYNPQQGAAAGLDSFHTGSTSTLNTSWFDAGMLGFAKAASHLTVNVERLPASTSVSIDYYKDFDDPDGFGTTLGSVSATGENILTFGTNSTGLVFDRIMIRPVIVPTSSDTPIIDSFVLHYVKIPNIAFAWTAVVDLSNEDGYKGRSNEFLADKLDSLLAATSPPFFTMIHRDESFRVRLSQVQGEDETGLDFRGRRIVSIVQIPSS